jgi:1,4-dihydroxy-2-naphthoate octaprenyltransferase
MARTSYKPFTIKAALELCSPPSLVASVMPVLVGGVAAVAFGPLVASTLDVAALSLDTRAQVVWVLMLITSVLMQAATNSLNDYHDFLAGTDTAQTILDEHDASIVYNGIDPRSARSFAWALLACAALSGLAVVVLSGWPLLVVGLVAALVVVLYSAGPRPISYLPLGEAVSGLVMGGFITGATYFAMTLSFTPLMIAVAVVPLVTIALIMQTNNTCDIDRDRASGRRTLPVILGRERSIALARGLAWASCAWMVLALELAAVFIWQSLLLLFINAIVAGCLYFLVRPQLECIAQGPYSLANRGPMMGNITAFCRKVNLGWAVALFIPWLLVLLSRILPGG